MGDGGEEPFHDTKMCRPWSRKHNIRHKGRRDSPKIGGREKSQVTDQENRLEWGRILHSNHRAGRDSSSTSGCSSNLQMQREGITEMFPQPKPLVSHRPLQDGKLSENTDGDAFLDFWEARIA